MTMLASAGVFGACGFDVTGSNDVTPPDGRPPSNLPPPGDEIGPKDVVTIPDQSTQPPIPTCPTNLPGPKMASAPDGGFCIDAFEVSAAQYADFVDASTKMDAATITLPSFCRFDAGFAPSNSASGPNQPVMYVNLCDAVAYCQWAGKHLCSGTGEWLRACTGDFQKKLPYGNEPDAGVCNVANPTSPFTHAEGGTYPGCEGGFAGVFDMVGNVAEWVNECTPDGGQCAVLGGAWNSNIQANCSTREPQPPAIKTTSSYGVGFRCCR